MSTKPAVAATTTPTKKRKRTDGGANENSHTGHNNNNNNDKPKSSATLERYAARIQRETTHEQFLSLAGHFLCDYNVGDSGDACNEMSHHGHVLIALVALHGERVLGLISANKPRSKREESEPIVHVLTGPPAAMAAAAAAVDVAVADAAADVVKYTRGNAPTVYIGNSNVRSRRVQSRWALKPEDVVKS